MTSVTYQPGMHVIFLPSQQAFAFGGGRSMIEVELLPGTYYEIYSTDAEGGICVGQGKEASSHNFALPSTLPQCQWHQGAKVAWIPKIKVTPATQYSPEFSMGIKNVRGVQYSMAEPWEKVYNKHGIFFNRPYEIEDIVAGVALKLKGVEELFYWEFFTLANQDKEKET